MSGVREARCERTDLPSAMCAHCRGDAEPLALHEPSYGRPFFARYDGRCADCGEDFVSGERIVPFADRDGYVHEDCAP